MFKKMGKPKALLILGVLTALVLMIFVFPRDRGLETSFVDPTQHQASLMEVNDISSSIKASGNQLDKKENNNRSSADELLKETVTSTIKSFKQKAATASYYRRELSQLLEPPIDDVEMGQALKLVKEWGAQNGLKTAEFLTSADLDILLKSTLMLVVYKAWGEYDAQSALNFSESHLTDLNTEAQQLAAPTILLASCDTSKDIKACIGSVSHTAEIDRAIAYIADEKSSIEEQPADAIIWAQLIQSESARLDLIDEIAELWAELDPEAAISWALENNEIESVGMRAMVQLSRLDPWSAQQILKSIPETKKDVRRSMLNSLISAQVEQENFGVVVALLDAMPADESRIRYFEGFVEQWSLKNPSAAASSIMNLPSGRRRDALLSTVAQYWGEQSPSDALDFISTINDQATRKNAMSKALVSWSFKDVDSASHWLQSQPASQQKDKTIARIAEQLMGSQVSQQSVLDLVELINDTNLRKTMLEKANRASTFEEES